MQSRWKQARVTSVPIYALGAIFFVPLCIGVFLANNNASQNDHANQVSRDVASMYAQGVDFSDNANQNIALRVAEGFGMDLRGGKGVLILSKIRVVHDGDCADATANCANKGHAVITQRFVIGDRKLRPSSFGTPAGIDSATGNVRNWAADPSARAQDFSVKLKPGEFTFAAECYLPTTESRMGVYSRAMF